MAVIRILAVSCLFFASCCVASETFPTQPVRIVVPFAPGGTTDIVARVLAQQLSDQTGKGFFVENRAGASGTIGNAFVAKAAPDGHTLMLCDPTLAAVPSLFKGLPFDVLKDFTPVTQIMGVPMALVVAPSLKTTTLSEFLTLMRTNPGRYNYGSAGAATSIHLAAELFKMASKIDVAHVPFKGAGDAMTAILGSQVQMAVLGIPTVVPHVNGGRVRALAVTGGKRSPILPDVPTMGEGGVEGMTVYLWSGLFGPAGMPRDITSRLQTETAKALTAPSVKERFTTLAGELSGSSPEEFARLFRSEVQRWSDVIRTAGITAE